ncbi:MULTISPECIES: WXG100 family type VII secretion target [unclassified Mycolicibacterium]|uniref:WXG100 family type VII secretion target n=1 Tax=unclassified Mycolicibacterium TaxID=2636767 RepID=UPI0012DFC098|nr:MULTISPECIES: WXG100 family type VII secretion target [unclassified Mycolicibacterium]MUL84313.1 WXG100 family type VII secretion target [Mycolicibacterium sp. CBMA 329]MUL89621.1 WXG100 family type VII secretion target [Mycolicibacterium sp. CBMA 331]MUL99797.1 WXG100 family type VII secretion target [Mycolicibacterium sp. CBMA 334]MUM29816.1 WXG100 family type VII secretion target [Mycolicibacterium sp. CBMA 295]MUM39136.1 WXG100 family type VII secretion target [Mycolicibacterium sp. CBM
MPESLKVDPTHLFMSADHLDMHEADHAQTHRLANADIAAASAGWVGSSGEAIKGKLSHLQTVADHISNELAHHRDAFRHIGNKYDTIDQDAAADLIGIRQNL